MVGSERRTAPAPVPAAAAKMASATSKKRPSKKNKRPSQPLSAYNLFFRFERARLLSSVISSKEQDCCSPPVKSIITTANDLRDFAARNPYEAPTSRKKRSHAKTHGAISFTDLSRLVSQSWRALDAKSKEPFQTVAHELKLEHYRKFEEERRRAKALNAAAGESKKGEVLSASGTARSQAQASDRAVVPLARTPTPGVVSKKELNSRRTPVVRNAGTLVADKAIQLAPGASGARVPPPPTRKPTSDEMEQFAPSFPEPRGVRTPPEWSLDTFLAGDSSISETDLDELLPDGSTRGVVEPTPSPALNRKHANSFNDLCCTVSKNWESEDGAARPKSASREPTRMNDATARGEALEATGEQYCHGKLDDEERRAEQLKVMLHLQTNEQTREAALPASGEQGANGVSQRRTIAIRPARRSSVAKEHRISPDDKGVVSPYWTTQTVAADRHPTFAGDPTSEIGAPQLNGPDTIEPLALHHNEEGYERSPFLRKDFANAWLTKPVLEEEQDLGEPMIRQNERQHQSAARFEFQGFHDVDASVCEQI